jgi:heme-degrading monooxygenase HmoA
MMTVITHVRIKEGQEPAWDEAFRERAQAAREQPGFVAVQLCIPVDAMNERVIIGTWESRADWEAWHDAQPFLETRRKLEEVDEKRKRIWWHEVVLEERRV